MKKLRFIKTFLFSLSLQIVFSQSKQIKGDTTLRFKRNIEFQQKLKFKNFEKSADEFNFRFWNHGQVIEISKDSLALSGSVTSYIYHTRGTRSNNEEIFSNKIILSSEETKNVYNVILNSGILNIPSDNEIENWTRGADGITYLIEYSDKTSYWFKNYWTPTSQDSIPEAIIVQTLVNNLSATLGLQEIYSSFKNDLPKKGCYNSGGTTNICYISNSLELGYSGATKLPFGFYSSYSASYIGKTKINSIIALQYNFDYSGFYHLNLQMSRSNVFYKKLNTPDFIAYNYQNRKINIDEEKNKFQNHQIKYGLNLKKNVGIGIGLDYVTGKYEKIGGHFYGYKWFSKFNISAVLTSSIFYNQVNYTAEIFKSFNFNYKSPIHRVSVGLDYERFFNYKDLYFTVRVLL